MNFIEFIDKANGEYAKNGRSKEFVAMEDMVINKGKLDQIYFFARCVKGADIKKLQAIILEAPTFEMDFYFAKYVKGSEIKLFLKKAIDMKDRFWVHKFVELAISPFNNRLDEIRELEPQLKEYRIEFIDKGDKIIRNRITKEIKGVKVTDTDTIINTRNEREAMYSTGLGADIFLYAQHVPGADIEKLQEALILSASPLDIFLFAKYIKGANPRKLFKGLEFAQRDYATIQELDKSKLERLERLNAKLNKAIAAGKEQKIIDSIKNDIREVEFEQSFSNEVKGKKRELKDLISGNFGR